MWTFLAAEEPASLIVPDSVQKANLAEAVNKIVNMDFSTLFGSLIRESLWILVKVLIALAIYFIGRWLVRRFLRLIDVAMQHRNVDISLRSFTRNTVSAFFTLLLILIVVSTLGVNVTSLIAVASAATLAIGMALSGTAQNFAGGVMILLFHPFRVGDYIETAEIAGTVKEVNVLYTVIVTPDNKRVTVPNGTLTNTAITDYSAETTRRVDIVFSAAYDSDLDRVKETILGVALAHEKVLRDPAPEARLKAQSASTLDFQLRAWCAPEDYWDVFFDVNEGVKKAFDENGIVIPFPQMDVHMRP